tara:strand:+ start:2550 stop:3164 length:615 start_codon:yes stop_codon:yes gene_type:complete
MNLIKILRLSQSKAGIICLLIGLVGPGAANSSEPCVETDQVACAPINMRPTSATIKQENPAQNTNMYTLFYSGGILSNQLPLAQTLEAPTNPDTKIITTDGITTNSNQSGDALVQEAAYSLGLLTLRENFYNHGYIDRKTTQKCLREYGYKGKIDGIWGDKTYFALLSYQEPDMALKEDGIFDGIKNIVANFRKCDEVLEQIIE